MSDNCGGCLAAQLNLPPAHQSASCRARIVIAMGEDPKDRAVVSDAKARASEFDTLMGKTQHKEAAASAAATALGIPVPPVVSIIKEPLRGKKRIASEPPAEIQDHKVLVLPADSGVKRDAMEGGDASTTLEGENRALRISEPPLQERMQDLNSLHEACTGFSLQAFDFIEVFSPGCFSELAAKFGLSCGGVYDLRTKWNLSDHAQRRLCFAEIQALDPILIIGSPMCGPDSPLHNLDPTNISPVLIKQALDHLEFACSLYRWQLVRDRLFLHERPWNNKGWSRPCMKPLWANVKVRRVRTDMCAFGMLSSDKIGVAPALKATGFMGLKAFILGGESFNSIKSEHSIAIT